MLRKIWISAACFGIYAALTAGAVGTAFADYITSNGTVQMETPFPDPAQTGANPPLTEITQLSAASGRLFTNQVNGAPFAVGSTVRSVGTVSITQAINGDNLPVFLPDGTPIAVIFAVEGTIVASGPPTAKFTGGSIWFTSRVTDNSGFNRDNPLTWNFDDAFAKFDLLPADDILTGPDGAAVAAPSVAVNLSSVNAIVGAQDGIFVFGEDSSFSPGPAFDNPGLGAFVGSNWLRDVLNDLGLPGDPEGLAAFTDQTVNTTVISLTAAQIAALDAISSAAFNFTGVFSEGGYTPTGLGVGTGDFNADLSAENYIITVSAVPEPTSLVVFGLSAGIILGARRRRKAA